VSAPDDKAAPPPEVQAYYDAYPEEARLETGTFRLEFARTKDILSRALPPPPVRIVDVGGAAGAYSAWLAERGYEVHLIDASPRLVAEARKRNAAATAPIASLSVGDARRLPRPDASAEAVLVMGPLYHLPERADRLRALREAGRVAAPGAVVIVAAISRCAPSMNGLSERLALDPRFVEIRDRGLRDGLHRNDTGDFTYFTTAYLHRPEELRREMEEASLRDVEVLGVEGPGWMLPDFDERWSDDALRRDLIHVAGALEREPSIVGASAHLLATGRRR
jgi:ubiquinone/menaquinone biosynthesis C-methylase UbiE